MQKKSAQIIMQRTQSNLRILQKKCLEGKGNASDSDERGHRAIYGIRLFPGDGSDQIRVSAFFRWSFDKGSVYRSRLEGLSARGSGTSSFYIGRERRRLDSVLFYRRGSIPSDNWFSDYKLYLGFPKKNSRATAFLQKSGARLVEEAYHDIFLLEDSKLPPVPNGLVRVTESNFSEFREIHQTEPDTYWNSDRMYAALDKWIIYLLYREEKAVGYLCARDGEIYHLGYRDRSFDPEVYKALVAKILQDFKKAGYPYLIFFNEEESQATALELGFSCVSEYVLYIK